MKGIGAIRKLNKTLPRHYLIIIYNQPNNERLNQKIERIQFLQLQVPPKQLLRVGYTTNEVLNLLNLGFGLGNCVSFIKLKQQVYHNTYLILFYKLIIYIKLVQQRMLQYFIAELMLSFISAYNFRRKKT